ncbi:MAG: SCP2 sterol-binding domain-containing protein [Candidatus Helarchaeota archaeon]
MPIKFPSIEYVEEFKKRINESEEYAKAAATWEGDLMFIIEGEGDLMDEGDKFILYLDLWHGKCRDLKLMLDEDEKPDVSFKIRGPESVWRSISEEGTNAINMIMTNQLQAEGDMNKLMRATKPAMVLTKIQTGIELEYLTREEADKLRAELEKQQ